MSTRKRRKPYMPDSDIGKRDWMERFIKQLEKDPQRYGLSDPRMFEYLQRTIRTYIEAHKALGNGALRSPAATAAKNEAREKAVALCRDLAMQLKWDSTLTDKEKKSLGLHVDQAPPKEAKLPEGVMEGTLGYPGLEVMNSPNGGHVIRYSDLASDSKAKPNGISHLLLFGAIGEKKYMRRSHARLLGAYTKPRFEIMYPMECGIEGLYVTYYGRWLTTRGEMSPWSPGISKMIGDTQVSLSECEFGHLFEKQGFNDALPAAAPSKDEEPDVVRINEDQPLLESAESDDDNPLFEVLGQLEAASMRMLDAG